jgi:hypothetical protein
MPPVPWATPSKKTGILAKIHAQTHNPPPRNHVMNPSPHPAPDFLRSARHPAPQVIPLLALLALAATSQGQQEHLVAIRENQPRVVLNHLVYEDSTAVSATVTFFDSADVKDAAPALIFATASSGDVEPVDLKPTSNPRVFITAKELIIRDSASSVTHGNQSIELAPGEIFSALLAYKLSSRTGGKVAFVEGRDKPVNSPQDLPKAGSAWLLVKVSGDPAKIPQLPQLRALTGASQTLSSSNETTLALVATAMELWAEGFQVGLEPRMQLHGNLHWPEHVRDGARLDSYGSVNPNNANVLQDENFGIRQSWAFLAMFDYDRARIPVGVIDSGFAPNPDFRTGDPLYSERNLSNATIRRAAPSVKCCRRPGVFPGNTPYGLTLNHPSAPSSIGSASENAFATAVSRPSFATHSRLPGNPASRRLTSCHLRTTSSRVPNT